MNCPAADKAIRSVLKKPIGDLRLSEKVKAAVKALRKERQLADEQANRQATI